jgi:pilus assembly protein CpaB
MIKRITKNRTTLGIASIVLALIISFGITPLLNRKATSQVEVIRANTNIEEGEKITPDKITKVRVGGYNLSPLVMTDENEIIGKYAKNKIYKDDFFFKEKITDIEKVKDHYLYDTEKLAISITIPSFASALSGKLQYGDIVTIMGTNEQDKQEIVRELMYVKVLSTTTKSGIDKDSDEVEEIPQTVTLEVNDIQAEKIAELELDGNMHIALIHRGDEETANKYLEFQEEYFLFLEENNLIDGHYELETELTLDEDLEDTLEENLDIEE